MLSNSFENFCKKNVFTLGSLNNIYLIETDYGLTVPAFTNIEEYDKYFKNFSKPVFSCSGLDIVQNMYPFASITFNPLNDSIIFHISFLRSYRGLGNSVVPIPEELF